MSDFIDRVWEETPKSWNWKSFSKTTVPIALRHNGSYDDMIASVIEADIGIDGSRPTLRISVNVRPPIEPTNSFNGDNDSIGNERLADHSKDRAWPVDAEDPVPECCEEMQDGVVAKEMVRGTAENRYSCLPAFSYMFETLNVGSSYCLMGFAHMRKVITVDGTHLYGKYDGVLLSDVAQDIENHIFYFEKLKEIVVDEPDLCFISDRHKSIANGIVNVYNHAHHGYCMRHLEFNNKCLVAAVILEHDIGFEKWSRAHFPGNSYEVMTLINEREYPMASIFNSIAKKFGELFRERHAYILKSMGNQMVPAVEKIARKTMIKGDSLYVENVIGEGNQFTMFDARVIAYVDLLEKSCSCREYDLIKIPCAHAMAILRSKHGNEYGMCHAPSLYPGRDRYSETIAGPKRTLGLAFLTQQKLNSTAQLNAMKGYKTTN
ncbi:hypothetical protein KY284_019445 [Solanum tuberosum]|nr:hypothetical protein KY284_019445 [Solanum tuberosum]